MDRPGLWITLEIGTRARVAFGLVNAPLDGVLKGAYLTEEVSYRDSWNFLWQNEQE